MQHLFADSFAQHRQADLLREAEMARLAGLATRTTGRRGLISTAIAAVGRFVIGEAGVATRHGVGSVAATPAPSVATAAAATRPTPATSTRSVTRPSPSL